VKYLRNDHIVALLRVKFSFARNDLKAHFTPNPQSMRKIISYCIEIAFFYTLQTFNAKILMFSIQVVTTPR